MAAVKEITCHQMVMPLSPTDSLLRLPDGQLQGLGQAHPRGGEWAMLAGRVGRLSGRETTWVRIPSTPSAVPASSVTGLT